MEVELSIYGTPFGADFWGKKEDKAYFDTMYDGTSDKQKFLIQSRLLNGVQYCYYNYLVYKDIVGNDGRDGGFFGISLRFNAYCNDATVLYRILDTVYHMHVLGNILETSKQKLRYKVPNFASVSTTLKQIETTIMQLMRSAFSNNSFSALKGMATSGNNCPKHNLYDCTNENIQSVVRQYGKIALSPYYSSNSENSLQKELSSKLADSKEQIKQLHNDILQRDKQIAQLQTESSGLKAQVRQAEQVKKISAVVAPIQTPITELAEIFRKITPATAKPAQAQAKATQTKKAPQQTSPIKSIKALLPFVNFILLVIIAACLYTAGHKKTDAESEETITEEERLWKSYDNDSSINPAEVEDNYIRSNANTPSDKEIIAKIEIPAKDTLTIGKEAKIPIQNNVGNAKWSIDGVPCMPDGDVLKFTPDKKKTFTVSCTVGAEEKRWALYARKQ